MSRISSSVGLITGIPIEETVTKLMQVAARPREALNARNEGLKKQQGALDTLSARLLSFQFAVNKLKGSTVFETREVTSSNTDALTASLPKSGTPTIGSYSVRPVRAASAQQLVSQRFSAADDDVGTGLLTFGRGGFVDAGLSLDALNGGDGVQRGKIRITDRSGASTTIDLSFARTVDDVVETINSNTDISVSASTSGDSFTLSDTSGGLGNLRVQEVGGGNTAASLGLAGVNVADSQVTGDDILRLDESTKLSTLNDGNGVAISREGIVDIEVELSDGSSLSIDLVDVTTVGDVLAQINAVDDAKLTASISADGRRLELHDLTGGSGEFSAANGVASQAAGDLGLVVDASGSTITGTRLLAGLRDTLLSSLNGGQGVGPLGEVTITDRDGGSASVDLSAAETLGDVIDFINAAAVDVAASVNQARNGIVIADTTGGDGDLTIESADATDTAEALGVAIEDEVDSVNSGALRRQTLSEATLLSSLNGGRGVVLGDIRVTNSAGLTKTADLNSASNSAKTVGDVIQAINSLNHDVEARINDSGDGILVIDRAGGDKLLGVADFGGDVAKSLRLTRASTEIEIDDAPAQVIDGTATSTIDLDDIDVSNTGISLSSLNGGAGVVRGDVRITDSRGRSIALDLNGADAGVTTIGQLIELINAKGAAASGGFGVTAQLDDSGTGIFLEDEGGGDEELTVSDVNGTTAAGLKLLGKPKIVAGKQVIDGIGAFAANASGGTALEAVADRINDLDAGVTAAVVFDGVGHRLSLTVNATGDANELLVDAEAAGLQFEQVSEADDALLLFGNLTSPGAGVLLNSADGKFAGAVGGADIAVKAASETPVTVTVDQTDASLVETVEDLVDAYNALRTDLGKLTAFDPNAQATGLLFGTNEALQVDSRLSRALTDRYFGFGNLRTLSQIGLTIADDGTLELDKAKLQEEFEANPAAVEEFLRKGETGVVAKIGAVIDRLTGVEESLFASRGEALRNTIESNDERLAKLDEQLDRQQERLFLQFYQLESIIAKMQTSLTAIGNLQSVPPLVSARQSQR